MRVLRTQDVKKLKKFGHVQAVCFVLKSSPLSRGQVFNFMEHDFFPKF